MIVVPAWTTGSRPKWQQMMLLVYYVFKQMAEWPIHCPNSVPVATFIKTDRLSGLQSPWLHLDYQQKHTATELPLPTLVEINSGVHAISLEVAPSVNTFDHGIFWWQKLGCGPSLVLELEYHDRKLHLHSTIRMVYSLLVETLIDSFNVDLEYSRISRIDKLGRFKSGNARSGVVARG